MKKLNDNFTTPKQSRRLLELGLPAWTADFFYPTKKSDMPIVIVDIKVGFHLKYAIPCWSVGRLIEIMKICSNGVATWYLRSTDKEPLIEQWIDFLESGLFEKDFDFSKLDE